MNQTPLLRGRPTASLQPAVVLAAATCLALLGCTPRALEVPQDLAADFTTGDAASADTCSTANDCRGVPCCYYFTIVSEGLACQDHFDICSSQGVDNLSYVVCASDEDCSKVTFRTIEGKTESAQRCCPKQRRDGRALSVCKNSCADG